MMARRKGWVKEEEIQAPGAGPREAALLGQWGAAHRIPVCPWSKSSGLPSGLHLPVSFSAAGWFTM
jgi:hypothetical protein